MNPSSSRYPYHCPVSSVHTSSDRTGFPAAAALPVLTTPIITPLLQTIHSYVSPLAWLGDGTGIVWSSILFVAAVIVADVRFLFSSYCQGDKEQKYDIMNMEYDNIF